MQFVGDTINGIKFKKMIKAKFIMNDEKSLPYISKKLNHFEKKSWMF